MIFLRSGDLRTIGELVLSAIEINLGILTIEIRSTVSSGLSD